MVTKTLPAVQHARSPYTCHHRIFAPGHISIHAT